MIFTFDIALTHFLIFLASSTFISSIIIINVNKKKSHSLKIYFSIFFRVNINQEEKIYEQLLFLNTSIIFIEL